MIESISHYRILSKLGEGGMGEVYLAEDQRLGRRVAIKFLSPGSIGNEQAKKRLIREAKAAAKLDHPVICSIYEVAEDGEYAFIVMQYVEGETLASRMQRKPLQVEESIDVAVQISAAIAEAHSHGVIHRDLKPQNIMITDRGQVKVMDFGLAKFVDESSMDQSEAETQSALTAQGTIVGTAPYMSPEQVKGQTLDYRTDIFSFGVVLYEMLAGRRPFTGQSAAAITAAILTEQPLPVARYQPQVPTELERIIRKCLEKDRERRYQTIRDATIDLENLGRNRRKQKVPRSIRIAALSVALIAILVITIWLLRSTDVPQRPEIKSVAVLPLQNLSGDSAQEYFADGITEALINDLAQIRALRVISRTSVMGYKNTRKSLPEIARELHVDAIVEGSVQRSGERVRVMAKLIHASTDTHLWAQEYERNLTDVLKLQSDVARAVANEIRIQVTPAERVRLASTQTVNPEAHEAYLLGRYYLGKGNLEAWSHAVENFERATTIAPDYASAYAGLATAWLRLGVFGEKLKEVEGASRAAALKAIELDEHLAEGHSSLASIKFYCDWDWSKAESEFLRSLELDPGGLDPHLEYGHLLMALGRHNEAIQQGQIGIRLDPISAETQTAMGRFFYRARKYQEALPHLLRAVELEPQSIGANFRLSELYTQMGRYEEAIATIQKARPLTSDDETFRCLLARTYALQGKRQEAIKTVSGIKGKSMLVAGLYAALGDNQEAFRLLNKAIDDRNSIVVIIKEEPALETLHSDPRWNTLLRRLNYPQ